MALNPQYEDIGKGFVAQYYAIFDDPLQRPNLVNLYNVSGFKNHAIRLSRSVYITSSADFRFPLAGSVKSLVICLFHLFGT